LAGSQEICFAVVPRRTEERKIISRSVGTSNISPQAAQRRRRHRRRRRRRRRRHRHRQRRAQSVRNRFPVERFREMIYCAVERSETAKTSEA